MPNIPLCTSCLKPSPCRTTKDNVSGVHIVKPGEALCDQCHAQRRLSAGMKPLTEYTIKAVKQLQLF